jgi:hypothetical protein
VSLDGVRHLASGLSALVPVQLQQRSSFWNILRRSPDRTPIVTADVAAATSRADYCDGTNRSFIPVSFSSPYAVTSPSWLELSRMAKVPVHVMRGSGIR